MPSRKPIVPQLEERIDEANPADRPKPIVAGLIRLNASPDQPRRYAGPTAVLYADVLARFHHLAARNRGVIGDERSHYRIQRGLHQRKVRRV